MRQGHPRKPSLGAWQVKGSTSLGKVEGVRLHQGRWLGVVAALKRDLGLSMRRLCQTRSES